MNVFINRKHPDINQAAYDADSVRMMELAEAQPGFISYRRFTSEDGESVSISEWESAEHVKAWRCHHEHAAVQGRGRAGYYQSYSNYSCDNVQVRHFVRDGA